MVIHLKCIFTDNYQFIYIQWLKSFVHVTLTVSVAECALHFFIYKPIIKKGMTKLQVSQAKKPIVCIHIPGKKIISRHKIYPCISLSMEIS